MTTQALASILMTFAATAAGFASARPPAFLPAALRPPLLRVLAAAAAVAAVALWPRTDGLFLAGMCALMALSASATAFVLLEPIAPRAMWLLAALSPLAAALLAAG
jgi:hypothetical protein